MHSGFESCILNLPGLSQELKIDARALKEVEIAVRQVSKIVKKKTGAIGQLSFIFHVLLHGKAHHLLD